MLADITVRFRVGTTPRESFVEACRLSQRLGVGILYDFNGTDVLVKGTRLVFAVTRTPEGMLMPDERFMTAVTTPKETD